MEAWKSIDDYLSEIIIREDAALARAKAESRGNGLPEWEVSPAQGQFLHLLVKIKGAKRILEIGALGGYSAIWLARALPPGGALISIEYDPLYAETAKSNIEHAGLSDIVSIIQGDAAVILRELIDGGEPPFDMIFIDADKANYPLYLELSLKLAEKGTVVYADNVVRDGELADANSGDPKTQGVRKYINALGNKPNIMTTAIQTVGCKGYDGFALSVVQ